MTPRIGASGADLSAASDWIVRGVSSVPRTGASEATGPPAIEQPGGRNGKRTTARNPDWNIRGRNAPGLEHPGGEALHWYIRGRSGPGLERAGRHKEEEAAAATEGRENMKKSNERMREDTKNMNRDERGEGDEGAA